MNARAVKETPMTDDPKIAKLQSDVQHLQSDSTEIKQDVKSLLAAVDALKTEFMSFKTAVARELGAYKAYMEREFGAGKAHMERELGSVKVSIERGKLWMVVTGVGTILSVCGTAFALARLFKP